MRKRMLIDRLRRRFPALPAATIAAMTDIVFEMIIDSLARGRRAEIRRFGTFFLSALGRRILRNPVSGEAMEVPARRLPRFKAGQRLREQANRGGG